MKRYLQVLFSIIFCLLLFVYSNETVKGQDEGGNPGSACLNYVYSDRYTTKCENEFENAIEVSWSLNYAVTSTDNLVRYQRQGASCSIPTSTACNSADNTQDCGCYRVDGFRKNITNLRPSSISNISRYDITVTTGAIGLAERACFAPSGASRNQTSSLTCITNRCGDGVKGTNEACDSSNLGGKVCTNFPNYESGSLTCDNSTCGDFTRVGGTGTTTPYAGCTACNYFTLDGSSPDRNIVSIQNPLNSGTIMASNSRFKCFIQMDHQGPDVACVMIKPDVSTTLRYCQFNKWNNITINSQTKAQAEFDCTVPQVTANTDYIVYGLYPLNHSSSSPTAVDLTFSCGQPRSTIEVFPVQGNLRGFKAVPADSNPPTVQLFETNTLSGATVDEFQNVEIGLNCTSANPSVLCNNSSFKLKKFTTPPTSCPTDYSSYENENEISTIPYPNPDSQKVWYCGAAKDNIGNVGFSTPFEVAPGCRNQCQFQDKACIPGPIDGNNSTTYYSECSLSAESTCLRWSTKSTCTGNSTSGGGCNPSIGCYSGHLSEAGGGSVVSVVDNISQGIAAVSVNYSIGSSLSGTATTIASGHFGVRPTIEGCTCLKCFDPPTCSDKRTIQCDAACMSGTQNFSPKTIAGDAEFYVSNSPSGYSFDRNSSVCKDYIDAEDSTGHSICKEVDGFSSAGSSCRIRLPFRSAWSKVGICQNSGSLNPQIKFVFDKTDSNPPNITKLTNSDNPMVNSPVTISVEAHDPSGIRQTTIFVDQGIAKICTNPNADNCSVDKFFSSARDTTNQVSYSAIVEDLAGNQTTSETKNFTVAELSSASCAGTGTDLRANGLVSTPFFDPNSKFGTSGGCVVDPRAAFVSFKIPTYADLFSLHYTQAKEFISPLISKLEIDNDATQNDLVFNQKQLIYIKGDLNLEGNPPSSVNGPGVVFVDGNLTFEQDYKYGKTVAPNTNDSSGTVFVVKGNVIIEPTVSEINAVIIAQGIIYTAGNGCAKNSVPLSNQLVINGSLVSLQDPYKDSGNQDRAIHFCRSLTPNNASPSEKINLQPKYLSILRNIFATSLQKWAEIPGFTNIQTGSPAVEKPEIQTFTGDSCFSSDYKATLSWTGERLPTTSPTCPDAFNVEISDVPSFKSGGDHTSSLCVNGTSTVAPNNFNPNFSFGKNDKYYARVYNGKYSATKDIRVSNTDCPPPSLKRVFVTSTTYNGNLGGIDGANAKCQARADAANLGGSWKAWISGDTTTNMTNRVFTRANMPYKLLNETLIANNWNDLLDDETIQNPINLDETRQIRNGKSWTGTNANGTWANNSCNGWTENSVSWAARIGSTTAKNSEWTAETFPTCEKLHSLYCFEQ